MKRVLLDTAMIKCIEERTNKCVLIVACCRDVGGQDRVRLVPSFGARRNLLF